MKAIVSKPVDRTPTLIENFGLAHWALLIVIEQHLFAKAGQFDAKHSPAYQDLLAHSFANETEESPNIALTDRGWEVAGLLRRWCADKRPIADFIVVRCDGCSRLRYGERRPCPCGSGK